MLKRWTLVTLAALGIFVTAGCHKTGATASAGAAAPLRIAVIPKGNTDVYWQYVHAGALAAGRKLGVKILFQGPVQDGDRAAEIFLMQNFVTQGVNGIVLAPVDSHALLPSVRMADRNHIPVVIIDSALHGTPGKDYVSFVATDNTKAGELAGNALAKLLHGHGKVVMLQFIVGAASTMARASGFLQAIHRYPGIHLLVKNQFGGSTVSKCKAAAMSMLNQIRQADGVFCVNETTTYGMLLALRDAGLVGKKKFVGFDWQANFKTALEKHEIDAVVVQDPYHMAYMGVTYLVDHIRGKTVPAHLATPAVLVTPGNIHTPKIAALIKLPQLP